jgi:hypothetical protein
LTSRGLRLKPLLLQQALQQAFRRFHIAPRLDDLIEDIAVLVNSPPQPVLLACDRDHDLVQMPDVAAAWRLAFEAAGVIQTKLQRPAADRLIGHDNAALEQHLLDQPQAQWEPEIEPDSVSDDLRWERVALVADGLAHASRSIRLALTPELK